MRPRPMALLAVTALVTLLATGTAAAHGDEGEVTLTKVEQTGPTTVDVEAGIVYEGDGHLAEDASVSATLTGPDGATVGPIELVRTGATTSLYAASIEVPTAGDWSVQVTSAEPEGSVEGTVSVAPDSGTPTSSAPDTTDATTTTVDAEVTAEALTPVASGDQDDDNGTSPALIVGASLVLAVLVIGGAFLVARARSAEDAADPPTT